MRTAAVLLLLSALLPAGAASAHDSRVRCGFFNGCRVEPPVEVGSRHDLRYARFAMTTEDGAATLMLTRAFVVVQLSDRTMRKIDRKFAEERDEYDGVLGSAIKSAVLGSVRSLLDHSLQCPIEDLRDVRYRDGTLELITEDGDHIFEGLDVNSQDVLDGFSERDALAFVREIHRAQEHWR